MKVQSLALGLLVVACVVKSAFAAGAAPARIDPTKIIDLTHPFDASTIYWPTEHPFTHEFEHYGMEAGGYFYAAAKYAAPEHGGTHMDAPVHFNREGMTVDQVPLSPMVGPAAVIDFSARAALDPDVMLTVTDINSWESAHGKIPDGAIVVARSGWGRFWPDKLHYLGTDKPGDVPHLRFPGFSAEAVDPAAKPQGYRDCDRYRQYRSRQLEGISRASTLAGREQAGVRERRKCRQTAADRRDVILHPDEDRQGHRRADTNLRDSAVAWPSRASSVRFIMSAVRSSGLRHPFESG